jgi:hypothetical protein
MVAQSTARRAGKDPGESVEDRGRVFSWRRMMRVLKTALAGLVFLLITPPHFLGRE